MTDRQIQETIARCVSIMVCYHNDERTTETRDMMVADLEQAARLALELGLDPREIEDEILGPVGSELRARYGRAVGAELSAIFEPTFRTWITSPNATAERAARRLMRALV